MRPLPMHSLSIAVNIAPRKGLAARSRCNRFASLRIASHRFTSVLTRDFLRLVLVHLTAFRADCFSLFADTEKRVQDHVKGVRA